MTAKKTTARKKKKRLNPIFVVVIGISLILAGSWSWQLIKIDQPCCLFFFLQAYGF